MAKARSSKISESFGAGGATKYLRDFSFRLIYVSLADCVAAWLMGVGRARHFFGALKSPTVSQAGRRSVSLTFCRFMSLSVDLSVCRSDRPSFVESAGLSFHRSNVLRGLSVYWSVFQSNTLSAKRSEEEVRRSSSLCRSVKPALVISRVCQSLCLVHQIVDWLICRR